MSSSAMLFVGQQCSDKHCYMVDFLPFKCQHCSQMYCGDHFKPTDHQCEKFDATKHDRVAPSCPICSQPVAIPLGQDPNIKMTHHMENECGKKREEVSSVPRCGNGKCRKVLYAPIKCDTCKQHFCAEHRFPTTHKCTNENIPITTTSAKQGPVTEKAEERIKQAEEKIKQAMNTGSARTAAGMAAIRRAVSEAKQRPQTTTSASSNTSPKTSHTNPFSKTDRWVVSPLDSMSSHSNPAAISTSTSSDPNSPASNSLQPSSQSCKTDALRNSSNPLTTFYAPPPLFAY